MTFEALTTILVLSIIVEFSTEIIKSVFPAVRGQYSRGAAVLLGMILCISTQSGILQTFNIHPVFPQIDYLLSGLIISRGSNIIHDVISRLDAAKFRG